ncbi:MAG: hypothetical protein QGI45_16545 [Myxococcota bacterium]|nr:hypothetical protein [Myxococcota bacterium]
MRVLGYQTLFLVLMLVGCADPQVQITVNQPAGFTFDALEVESLVVNILYPPLTADAGLRFDCDDIAYQDVTRAEALSHMGQQLTINKGQTKNALDGLDRHRTKLFWLEGYSADFVLVLAGCAALAPSDVDARVSIDTWVSLRAEVASFDPSLPIDYDAELGGDIPASCDDVQTNCPDAIQVTLKQQEDIYTAGRDVRLRLITGLVQDVPMCNATQVCEGGESDGRHCTQKSDCRPAVLPDKEEILTSDGEGEVTWSTLKAPPGIAGPLILEVVAKWQSHEPLTYTFGVSLPKSGNVMALGQASAFDANDKPHGFVVGALGPLGQPGVALLYEDLSQSDDGVKYDLSVTYFGGGQVGSATGSGSESCSETHDRHEICYQTTYHTQLETLLTVKPVMFKGRGAAVNNDVLIGVRSSAWDRLEMVYDDAVAPSAIVMHSSSDTTSGVGNVSQVLAVDDCHNENTMDEVLLRAMPGGDPILGLRDLEGQDIQSDHPFAPLMSGGISEELISSQKEFAYSACIQANDNMSYRVLFEDERNLNVVLATDDGLLGATWNLVLSGGLTHSKAITGAYAEPAMIFGVRPLGTGLALVRSQLLLGDSVLEIQERDTDTIPFVPQRSFAQDFDGDGALDVIAMLHTNFGVSPVVFYMVRGVKYKGQRIAGYVAQTGIAQSTMALLDVNCDGLDDMVMLNSWKGVDASEKVSITGLHQDIDYSTLVTSSACAFNDD